VIVHYQLPFWSIVLIAIGGQAIGMRSMAIYELNADYVKYSRFLGIKDRTIVGYVFRNAMLPQITGLDILREWAGEISFEPAEVDKERGVVLEEWRLGRGALLLPSDAHTDGMFVLSLKRLSPVASDA